ncbi:MAG: SUMF1/EgtB/PvdO family nonheme iron enzyme [Saprospiraceae bacterium]|nr:SUMF1/EgtB/PvdO family nonheme iron enzyme [Saprospiraceae bacterium]
MDHAFFFAVETYKNRRLTKQKNPVKKARAIAATLQSRFGFETEVLENPTQAQIVAKLNELTRLYSTNADGRHPADGQLFVFFSGHGMSEDENGYFLPADADPAQPWAKGIAYEIWRPKIDKINCRHILVAIDACYSVRFDPEWRTKNDGQFKRPGELTDAQKALANYEQYTARVFFTSDNKEDKTPDRSNFARKLLEGLRSAPAPEGFLTSSQLFANHVQGATPTPRAGAFGLDDPGSVFLFYDLSGPGKPDTQRPVSALPSTENRLDYEWVKVRGGSFEMGCTGDQQDCSHDERPAHYVTVRDFYIGKYEVTQQLWREVMGANPSHFQNCDDCPVEQVSWNDAQEFVRQINSRFPGSKYRLPTEAEWEYAARGGGRAVMFGNGKNVADPAQQMEIGPSSAYVPTYSVGWAYRKKTYPVGSQNTPNALDLHDMSGNVWEWCEDVYHETYEGAPSDGSAWLIPSGNVRVVRGGSWSSGPLYWRVASRFGDVAGYRDYDIGFRLAKDAR